MSDINTTVLSGRIAKDLELRTSAAGAVTTLRLAHSAGQDAKGEEKTLWIDVTLWGKTAENTVKYLKKGDKVTVSGRLTQRTYTNKDGANVTTTEINGYDVQFPEKGASSSKAELAPSSSPNKTEPAPTFEPSDTLPF